MAEVNRDNEVKTELKALKCQTLTENKILEEIMSSSRIQEKCLKKNPEMNNYCPAGSYY